MAVCSAPGKTLLLGAYAVLQKPNISFVCAVDARVWARAEKLMEKRVVLEAPPVDAKAWGTWQDNSLALDSTPEEEKKLSFLKASVEAALEYLEYRKVAFRGVRVETYNDEAFSIGDKKTGMGSSAASVVAAVASVLAEHGLQLKDNLAAVHKLAQLANYRAQAKVGSGFDVASACYGSVAYSRFSPETLEHSFAEMMESDWDFRLEKMRLPKGMRLLAGFTGKSANTREFVKKVHAFDEKHHQEHALLMEELNGENEKAVLWLKKISDLSRKEAEKYERLSRFFEGKAAAPEVAMLEEELTAFREFKHAFENGRRLAKQLGEKAGIAIEGDEATALIGESEKNGAFVCKLPGAGGGDSIAALCLSKEAEKKLKAFWQEKGVRLLEVTAADEGAKEESEEAWDKLQAGNGG